MRHFHREDLLFSLCGLNCLLCPMQVGGYCPGCGGGEDNQSCAIARCSREHGDVPYCHDCPEYPCARYAVFDEYDSFLPQIRRDQDVARFRAIGAEAYHQELREKRALLQHLLADYNDGRHKSCFSLAAYLLPVEDLRAAVDQLDDKTNGLTLKDKAMRAAAELERRARAQGVTLKLRKKPKK